MGYFQVYVITCCAKVGFLGKRNLQSENPMSLISVLPSRDYCWLYYTLKIGGYKWSTLCGSVMSGNWCAHTTTVCPHNFGVPTAHFVLSTIHTSVCP